MIILEQGSGVSISTPDGMKTDQDVLSLTLQIALKTALEVNGKQALQALNLSGTNVAIVTAPDVNTQNLHTLITDFGVEIQLPMVSDMSEFLPDVVVAAAKALTLAEATTMHGGVVTAKEIIELNQLSQEYVTSFLNYYAQQGGMSGNLFQDDSPRN